jgi:metal-responsive CopG/Arc/MetJ family transcriptional regulator
MCMTVRNTLRMAVHTSLTQPKTTDPVRAPRIPVNLSLPEALVAELDRVSGPRNRSAFVEAAVRKAVQRERLRLSIERTAGSLSAENYPHWRTSEATVEWVREMRAEVTSVREEPA